MIAAPDFLATLLLPSLIEAAAHEASGIPLEIVPSVRRGNAGSVRPPSACSKRAGHTNVETRAMDGESLELANNTFDAVISRVGLSYFPDQQKALREMKRVLVPGGRVAAIVYATADTNGFFSVPVSIVRRHAKLGPPLAGQPGPFSLGAAGAHQNAFEQAGFRDVKTERVAAPLRMKSAAECLRFEQESFGALHQMLSSLDADGRALVWKEVGAALADFEKDAHGFVGPCALVIGVGTK